MKRSLLLLALIAFATSTSALPTMPWVVDGSGKSNSVWASLPTMPFVWPRWVKELFQPNPFIVNA